MSAEKSFCFLFFCSARYLLKAIRRLKQETTHFDSRTNLEQYHCRLAPACQFSACAFCNASPDPLQRKPDSGREHCDPARSLCGLSHSRPSESTLWPTGMKCERWRSNLLHVQTVRFNSQGFFSTCKPVWRRKQGRGFPHPIRSI